MEYAPLPTDDQLQALASELSDGGRVRFVRRIEGGISCTTDVVALIEPGGGSRLLVLRRRRPKIDRKTALAEFGAMRFLHRHGAPVPEPVWFDHSCVFQEPASAMEYVDGSSRAIHVEPVEQARQMAVMLAKLHRTPVNEELRRTARDSISRELAQINGPAPEWVTRHPLGQKLWDRMRDELGRTEFEGPAFTHGDYWRGNMMWRGDQLVAVVDFEDCGIGDPAADVAAAVIDMRQEGLFEAAETLVQTYRAGTGRKLGSLDYWLMFELRRSLPDVAFWIPSFKALDENHPMTAGELQARHTALIEGFLAK